VNWLAIKIFFNLHVTCEPVDQIVSKALTIPDARPASLDATSLIAAISSGLNANPSPRLVLR
jgi:hypothetical protein